MEQKTAMFEDTAKAEEVVKIKQQPSSETAESKVKEKIVDSFLDVRKYKLQNPVKVMDKTITEIDLDYTKLKGKDIRRIAALPECQDEATKFTEFSKTYYAHCVSRIAGITIHELDEFSWVDFTSVTMLAQSFLMHAVSKVTE
jgi:hypothetical protein